MMATPEHAVFWNKIAEKYAAQPVADPDAFDRKIAVTRSLMSASDTVLEIGCGTGSLALRLHDACNEIHGLDISDEMVRIARGKVADAGADNVTFHVGEFDDRFAAFGDDSADGLLAYSILHLVADPAETVARIYRTLKPGGYFVSSTVCTKELWMPIGPVIAVMRWFGKAPDVLISLSRAQMLEMLERAGFVDIQTPDVGAKKAVAFIVARKPESPRP